jgi:isoquinoline 1-oxidoreductase beta subunit
MDRRTHDSPEPQAASPGHATRRDVLIAAAVLTVAGHLPEATANTPQSGTRGKDFAPGPFVRIASDGAVTVIAKHLEMGQGVFTGLATIIAEELDADWSQIRVEAAPADAKLYNNLTFGAFQGTGGSSSIANSFDQLRMAGATARALLVTAAAQRWKVAAGEITVQDGTLTHAASGRTARFGELVAAAAKLKVPSDVRPKPVNDYVRIGKDAARVDSLAKSNGSAIFTQDLQLPGMLVAAVVHPPRFGAKVKSFDAAKARAVKGVQSVVAFQTPVRAGVAVLASDFWSAKKGRDALSVEWDESAAFKRSSEELFVEYRALAAKPGTSVRKEGNVEQALGAAARTLTATYEFPFLAHATMEPMNCVVRLGPNQCEIWNGVQLHTGDQFALAQFLKLPQDRIVLNQLYAGGSFGRRGSATSDYVLEAAAIAKAAGVSVPVKLVWTREEDMRAGLYRPMYVHTLTAGLDQAGNLTGWQHRIAGQSILAGTFFGGEGVDPTSVEGAVNLPYDIPNLAIDLHTTQLPVPVLWWRAVGATHTAFATECFLDEIARSSGQDPLALRTKLLAAKHARHRKVLELVAEKSGWTQPRPKDEFWGLALHESFKSVVAQVAQVKRTAQGLRLQRVVCAVDCGLAVNPNIVAMQMESGIGYGLAAALSGAITLKEGRVQQGNFDDYPVLRINQMPEVEVHIVPSKNQPTGVGEPATPVIAPALANALALAKGEPVRSLPLSAQGIALV